MLGSMAASGALALVVIAMGMHVQPAAAGAACLSVNDYPCDNCGFTNRERMKGWTAEKAEGCGYCNVGVPESGNTLWGGLHTPDKTPFAILQGGKAKGYGTRIMRTFIGLAPNKQTVLTVYAAERLVSSSSCTTMPPLPPPNII